MGPSPDAGVRDAGGLPDAAPAGRDWLAPQEPDPDAVVATTGSLEQLLEQGTLGQACDAWRADPGNRRKKLMCGKAMFFYEGFGTIGVPAALFDFFGKHFPEELGPAYSRLGLVPDPYSEQGRPLGVAPGAPLGSTETLAFTCASCHFGRLPDGRYSVGAPNHAYDYGKHILNIMLAGNAVSPTFDPSEHHPDAMAAIAPVRERLAADNTLRLRLLFAVLPLVGTSQGAPLTVEMEGHYAHWKSGTLDFLMPPLPVDDGVHTISKIIGLWGITTTAEEAESGMPHALLAWTGDARSLHGFLDGFVAIGDGTASTWDREAMSPLHDFIMSLRAPRNPQPAAPSLVAEGRALFAAEGCLDCHNGPRGCGTRQYTYVEIGTDDAMKWWGDPMLTGELCCGLGEPGGPPLMHGLKSPRLAGAWSLGRYLHNGSVETLEELLCMNGPRTPITEHAFGNGGHEFGCNLTAAEKTALLAYLRSL